MGPTGERVSHKAIACKIWSPMKCLIQSKTKLLFISWTVGCYLWMYKGLSSNMASMYFQYLPIFRVFYLQGEMGPTGPPGPPGAQGEQVLLHVNLLVTDFTYAVLFKLRIRELVVFWLSLSQRLFQGFYEIWVSWFKWHIHRYWLSCIYKLRKVNLYSIWT